MTSKRQMSEDEFRLRGDARQLTAALVDAAVVVNAIASTGNPKRLLDARWRGTLDSRIARLLLDTKKARQPPGGSPT